MVCLAFLAFLLGAQDIVVVGGTRSKDGLFLGNSLQDNKVMTSPSPMSYGPKGIMNFLNKIMFTQKMLVQKQETFLDWQQIDVKRLDRELHHLKSKLRKVRDQNCNCKDGQDGKDASNIADCRAGRVATTDAVSGTVGCCPPGVNRVNNVCCGPGQIVAQDFGVSSDNRTAYRCCSPGQSHVDGKCCFPTESLSGILNLINRITAIFTASERVENPSQTAGEILSTGQSILSILIPNGFNDACCPPDRVAERESSLDFLVEFLDDIVGFLPPETRATEQERNTPIVRTGCCFDNEIIIVGKRGRRRCCLEVDGERLTRQQCLFRKLRVDEDGCCC